MKVQNGRAVRLVAVVAVAALALSACGRGGDSGGGETTAGGIKTSPGFDGKTISLGIISVSSGPLAPVAAPIIAAQQAWADFVNDNGGIGGYQVKLVVTDSGYNPAQAIQQYERTKNDVAMFAHIFGTPIAQTLVPKLATDQILAGVGTGDGSLLRTKEAILAFTPYESQVLDGIDFNLKNGPLGKDAVFCTAGLEGPLADAATKALAYAKDQLGIKTGPSVSIAQTATDATPQVLQLQDGGCDVVIVQAVNSVTIGLTSAASKLGYEPHFTTTSTGYEPVAADNPLYSYVEKNLTLVADAVPYGLDSAAGMADLMKAHDAYAKDTAPTTPFVLGWVTMLGIQSVLEQAIKDKDLSHAGLVNASSELSTFDMKGIGPVWGWGKPEDRTAPTTFTVFRPDASDPAGLSVVEANVTAPDAAVNYPY